MKSLLLIDELHKQLKFLSVETGKSISVLTEEALNLLFESYSKEKGDV